MMGKLLVVLKVVMNVFEAELGQLSINYMQDLWK
jgi:hypothetical protein